MSQHSDCSDDQLSSAYDETLGMMSDAPTGAAPMCEFTDEQLQATWEDTVKSNLEGATGILRAQMLFGPYPQECILTTLRAASTTTKRGKAPRAYPRKGVVKLPGEKSACKKKVGLHQLAAWIRMKRRPRHLEQASHYWCDNDRCINPGHLVFELSGPNTTRNCCKLYGNGQVAGYKCPHKPTCKNCTPCGD